MQRPRFTLARAVLLLALAITLLSVLVVAARTFFPEQGADRRADAIVSLAPSLERLPLAERLFAEGRGGTLAVSWGGASAAAARSAGTPPPPEERLCAPEAPPGIVCFVPDREDTLGEARRVAELAAERDWSSITVVTSRYHASRTQAIFERCLPAGTDVEVVYSEPDLGPVGWAYHLAYESAASVKALVETAAGCR